MVMLDGVGGWWNRILNSKIGNRTKLRDLVTILSMLSTYNKPAARVTRENGRCSKNSLFSPFLTYIRRKLFDLDVGYNIFY